MKAIRSLVGRWPSPPRQAPLLTEVLDLVAAATLAPEQCRHRVPRVGSHLRRRGVVAAHTDHVGSEGAQLRHERIERFDRRDLADAIAVLAGRVGVLVVQEEVVVVVPRVAHDGELCLEIDGPTKHVHAEQSRDAAVHRVDGDRRGAQAVALREAWQLAVGVETAEQHHVGLDVRRERGAHLRVDFGDQVGGALGLGVERLDDERRDAGVLRVGVGQPWVEPGAAQHDEHPVLALVAEEHLDARDVHCRLEQLDNLERLDVGDAPGATVGDRTAGVERCQVAARRDVARS